MFPVPVLCEDKLDPESESKHFLSCQLPSIGPCSLDRGIPSSVKVCPWCGVGLLRLFFLYCGVINKLTLLLVLAAPVKRKGARGEVRSPETPLLCALFYLKGPAPCCYWLAVTCLSYVLCLSLKAVLSRLVTVL